MASLKYEILLLDRNTRFALWQIKMQAVLAQMDLEDALLGIDNMPSTLTDEENKRKDRKALTQLHLYLSNKILQDRLYVHHLEKGASIHEHLTVFKEILSNLEAMESLTVDDVYDSLTSYDKMKHLVVKPDSQGGGLIVRGRQDQNVDDDHGMTQEQNPRGKSKGRLKSSNRGKTCNFCKKEGHIKSECYQLQNKTKREATNQKGKQLENFGEVDVVEDYSDGELLVASVNNSKVSEELILDSGCTFHISPNRDWFTTYETVSEGVVLMGKNASCKIAGVGTIKVKMFDGVVRTLSDIRHVPELKRNLILLSTLDSKGYRYTTERGVLKISKGSLIVMKGQRKTAKLYVLQGSTITDDAAVTSSSLLDDDITKLWHMRLGHMSENGMAELSKRGLLDGSPYSTAKWRCRTNEQNDHGECSMYVVKCQLTKVVLGRSSLYCIFLINQSPSVAIEKKTSQEVWSGNPTNYSDLKIFGCPVYAHDDNGKLEPRSIKCVFLGYKASVKGYKLWCPENRKVVINRDVVFDETAMLHNLSLKYSSNKENQKQVEH
ncbi:hypothetical protein CXB51_003445 [Gossypium anomalum]|uniref:Retrovirus-related Pol polyprotein from transposon TNT 1-94 n=1 Tax=Gossypium anomalum TaxID=47600 RepID=A0A8J5Z7C0_9ROSI|nr:hypothetical protein CXB51_003445 [Gossypium anomalum]